MQPIFRSQAIEHAGTRRYGSVVLARPVSFAFLTLLFVAIAVAVVVFFVQFSYTRKAHVSGVLRPTQGLVRVLPMQAGVVAERKVNEGQTVKAGEVLFVLLNERASAAGGDAGKVISALLKSRRDSLMDERAHLRQQVDQRIDATRRRADDFAAESRRVEEQIALQQRRVALAEESVARYNELTAANFVSSAQAQGSQAELLDQRQRLADLQRANTASARSLATTRAELRDLRVQAQRDQAAALRNVAVVEQDLTENEARREFVVRAPQDGTATAISAEPGQAVSASQVLLAILPVDTQLEAELYAPSRAVGFLKPGMDVVLRYPAYPYQKFGQYRGQVREIAGSALRAEELAMPGTPTAAGPASEPLYRVRVKLDRQAVTAYGANQPLRSGMALEASVLLEQRRLYEWVLEPLYSISGRV